MIVKGRMLGDMAQEPEVPSVLAAATLRTSYAMLSAQIALGRLIDNEAVAPTGEDPTTVDLLTRLDQAPGSRLRAVELSRQLLLSPSHISRTIDKAEVAVFRRKSGLCGAADELFVDPAVFDKAFDGVDSSAVFFREFLELRHTRHGAVLVHYFADDGRGCKAGQTGEIDGTLSLSGAHEYAALARA